MEITVKYSDEEQKQPIVPFEELTPGVWERSSSRYSDPSMRIIVTDKGEMFYTNEYSFMLANKKAWSGLTFIKTNGSVTVTFK